MFYFSLLVEKVYYFQELTFPSLNLTLSFGVEYLARLKGTKKFSFNAVYGTREKNEA